jgi:serine/threonine-protein kinase
MEGQIIAGKYRLIRTLGKGGMGTVWLAEHLSLHTPVAIKLIDSEAAKNPLARSRFDREAQLAARIRSAHVVKVLDHGMTDDGLPYIAMECLAGESLRERLTARGRLTPAETAKVVSHVCRALARSHEAGLVHRDLKPENIFVAREDDDEIVKILDFGVAKATDLLSMAGIDPTRTGTLLGTPYYMSPEQAQGLKSVDFRSDLWSLGVVVYECLTAKRPFTAPALGVLIAKILGAPPATLAEAAPDANIPPDVELWMRKALARDPAARFASAKELSEAFMVAAGTLDTMDRGGQALTTASSASGPLVAASTPDLDPDMAATVALQSGSDLSFPRAGASVGAPVTAPVVAPTIAEPAPVLAAAAPASRGGRGGLFALLAVALVAVAAVIAFVLRR